MRIDLLLQLGRNNRSCSNSLQKFFLLLEALSCSALQCDFLSKIEQSCEESTFVLVSLSHPMCDLMQWRPAWWYFVKQHTILVGNPLCGGHPFNHKSGQPLSSLLTSHAICAHMWVRFTIFIKKKINNNVHNLFFTPLLQCTGPIVLTNYTIIGK